MSSVLFGTILYWVSNAGLQGLWLKFIRLIGINTQCRWQSKTLRSMRKNDLHKKIITSFSCLLKSYTSDSKVWETQRPFHWGSPGMRGPPSTFGDNSALCNSKPGNAYNVCNRDWSHCQRSHTNTSMLYGSKLSLFSAPSPCFRKCLYAYFSMQTVWGYGQCLQLFNLYFLSYFHKWREMKPFTSGFEV